jgi:hypothetical protein
MKDTTVTLWGCIIAGVLFLVTGYMAGWESGRDYGIKKAYCAHLNKQMGSFMRGYFPRPITPGDPLDAVTSECADCQRGPTK